MELAQVVMVMKARRIGNRDKISVQTRAILSEVGTSLVPQKKASKTKSQYSFEDFHCVTVQRVQRQINHLDGQSIAVIVRAQSSKKKEYEFLIL
ncbi:unnamed protein product, partial [Brenthis ino]